MKKLIILAMFITMIFLVTGCSKKSDANVKSEISTTSNNRVNHKNTYIGYWAHVDDKKDCVKIEKSNDSITWSDKYGIFTIETDNDKSTMKYVEGKKVDLSYNETADTVTIKTTLIKDTYNRISKEEYERYVNVNSN